jgi:flagellar motor component MotA
LKRFKNFVLSIKNGKNSEVISEVLFKNKKHKNFKKIIKKKKKKKKKKKHKRWYKITIN